MVESHEPVVLVTGSARGLGLACARQLLEGGARVHVVWRSGTAAPRGLVEAFGRERVHRADLEEPGAARALVDAVTDVDGALDRLVHAVGPYHEGRLDERTPAGGAGEVAAQMWSGNVATAIAIFDAARPHLRAASAGAAVFFGVAGLAGLRARRDCAVYAAAKSALLVLVRSWAVEEGPFGVRVNAVSPGVVPHDDAHPATLDPKLLARIPAGRTGRPEEIADAVEWLLGPRSAHVTGVDLPVAGGWML
jgi:3-oxoacyl-[acyl-carrier protein] reductase